ncbi:MAG: serine/threonine-protein kinase [Terriglobales bacterium]
MPLTEIEKAVTKSVAQFFAVQREPVSHEQLLRSFNDPRPIITLKDRYRIISAQGSSGQLTYLPTIQAFQYCGDESLRQNAKAALEVVISGLKLLLKVDYNANRQHPTSALIEQLRAPNSIPIPDQIWLGLFLARQIPSALTSCQVDERNTVTSFRINEHILTLEPKDVWDDFLREYNTVDENPRTQSAVEKQTPNLTPKKVSDWPPSQWKIEGSLGEGGQGWTYKARRKTGSDQKPYVLKRLKNKERLSRFRNEIAALTKLQHPGILKIVETSEESETPYFVAEYCEGGDLGKVNLSGKDLLTRLKTFRQVCDAVKAAHDAGILHRDLKPQNILIRKDDSIAVGDFGLCIDLNDAKERATQTLEAVGAERYIAPEVAKGRVPEPQPTSDLYSLGKVLYFILSGRTLVREEYTEGEDDLRTRDAGPNMHFVYELFDKTITERPQDRYQNVADLLYALDTVIERVQLKAHILKPSVRQHCMFCVTGEYQVSRGPGTNELLLFCSNCGNMQRFASTTPKPWWENR